MTPTTDTTGRALDHMVIAVPNLDAAAAQFEALGFTLTPRAQHNDEMGTSNRLIQFENRSFIELLEVDRPDGVTPHDPGASPPVYSFGAQNKALLNARDSGGSLIVFQTQNAEADRVQWSQNGVANFAPYRFTRQATLPDQSQVEVAFTLAFAAPKSMPLVGFFVCENERGDVFWKPDFMGHSNGAAGVQQIIIASDQPEKDARTIAQLFDGKLSIQPGGASVACGESQSIAVLTHDAVKAIDPGWQPASTGQATIAGLVLSRNGNDPGQTTRVENPTLLVNSAECGCFVGWT